MSQPEVGGHAASAANAVRTWRYIPSQNVDWKMEPLTLLLESSIHDGRIASAQKEKLLQKTHEPLSCHRQTEKGRARRPFLFMLVFYDAIGRVR